MVFDLSDKWQYILKDSSLIAKKHKIYPIHPYAKFKTISLLVFLKPVYIFFYYEHTLSIYLARWLVGWGGWGWGGVRKKNCGYLNKINKVL